MIFNIQAGLWQGQRDAIAYHCDVIAWPIRIGAKFGHQVRHLAIPHYHTNPNPMEAPMSNISFASETMAETHYALRHNEKPSATKNKTAVNPLKKFMGGLTALAVAGSLVLASAVPSHADRRGDNVAKALAAAIVLGLIVNNANKHNNPPAPPKPVPVKQPRVPGICAIEFDSDRGYPVTVYSESCLEDEGFDYRLPSCGRSVRIYGQRDRIYSAQCLRDAGFRVGGH